MFGRMFIGRRIAAADVPARLAQTKMNPSRADLKAILAPCRARQNFPDLAEMTAFLHLEKFATKLRGTPILTTFSLCAFALKC